MKRLLTTVSLALFAMSTYANEAFYYVSAHPDDWQLFIMPYPYHNLQKSTTNKIVFIHVTAGDGGLGANPEAGKTIPYYTARERGAIESVAYLVGSANAHRTVTSVKFGTKTVRKVSNQGGRVVAYFLRIVDGNGDGSGFAGTGFNSLQKLYNGDIPTIQTVGGTQTYTKQELIDTMAAIYRLEGVGTLDIFTNQQDDDLNTNTGSHSDHQYSSKFSQAAANQLGCIHQHFFLDYISASLAPNIEDPFLGIKWGMWYSLNNTLVANQAPSTFEPVHNAWVPRSYYNRTVYGTGNCQF